MKAKNQQQKQSDEYPSDQEFMERRLEMIKAAAKKLFCPELEEEDELRF